MYINVCKTNFPFSTILLKPLCNRKDHTKIRANCLFLDETSKSGEIVESRQYMIIEEDLAVICLHIAEGEISRQ